MPVLVWLPELSVAFSPAAPMATAPALSTIRVSTNATVFGTRRREKITRISSTIGTGLIAMPIAAGISEAIVWLMVSAGRAVRPAARSTRLSGSPRRAGRCGT